MYTGKAQVMAQDDIDYITTMCPVDEDPAKNIEAYFIMEGSIVSKFWTSNPDEDPEEDRKTRDVLYKFFTDAGETVRQCILSWEYLTRLASKGFPDTHHTAVYIAVDKETKKGYIAPIYEEEALLDEFWEHHEKKGRQIELVFLRGREGQRCVKTTNTKTSLPRK